MIGQGPHDICFQGWETGPSGRSRYLLGYARSSFSHLKTNNLTWM